MKTLFILVEGKDDITFVENILSRLFINHSILLLPIQYQKIRNHEVKKHIKSIKSKNHDYVLLTDLDSHTYPCITSRKESRLNELDNSIDKDKIIVVKEELESWCLAGVDTSLEEYRDLEIPENTENTTKEDFDKIIEKTSMTKYAFIAYLAKNFDFKLAIKRNKSFKYFLSKYNLI